MTEETYKEESGVGFDDGANVMALAKLSINYVQSEQNASGNDIIGTGLVLCNLK